MFKKTWLLTVLIVGLTCSSSFSQTWRYTGAINSVRRHMVPNVLQNGKILISGGIDSSHTPLSTCELYDPATETWSTIGSMIEPRSQQTTNMTADGKVYVFAGNTNVGMSNTVEVFDPTTNTWGSAGNISIGRMNHTSTLLPNGKVLIVGGFDGSDFLSSCELYDPITQTSESAASLHLGRHDHSTILLQSGKVLVTGGRIGGADGIYLNEVELYDPSTNTWTVLADMHSSRIIGTLVEFSDQTVLAAGGRATANNATQESDLFDPTTSTWTETDSMKERRHWQGESLMPSDRYLITGGIKDAVWTSHYDVEVSNTCEWYDKTNRSWYYAPDMNLDRSQHAQVYFTQDSNAELPHECVMVIGGIRTGVSVLTNTCEILDVSDQEVEGFMKLARNNPLAVEKGTSNVGLHLFNNGTSSPELVVDDPTLIDNGRVEFYSPHGAFMSSFEFSTMGQKKSHIPLDTKHLNNGVYLIRVFDQHVSLGTLKLLVLK